MDRLLRGQLLVTRTDPRTLSDGLDDEGVALAAAAAKGYGAGAAAATAQLV
jgi:hypothetical protein